MGNYLKKALDEIIMTGDELKEDFDRGVDTIRQLPQAARDLTEAYRPRAQFVPLTNMFEKDLMRRDIKHEENEANEFANSLGIDMDKLGDLNRVLKESGVDRFIKQPEYPDIPLENGQTRVRPRLLDELLARAGKTRYKE
jgi:hypothetical protein